MGKISEHLIIVSDIKKTAAANRKVAAVFLFQRGEK